MMLRTLRHYLSRTSGQFRIIHLVRVRLAKISTNRAMIARGLAPGGLIAYETQWSTTSAAVSGLAQCTEEQAVKAIHATNGNSATSSMLSRWSETRWMYRQTSPIRTRAAAPATRSTVPHTNIVRALHAQSSRRNISEQTNQCSQCTCHGRSDLSQEPAVKLIAGPAPQASVKLLAPPVPTREDMLRGVEGFFPRLIAHIKYVLMRQHRPWTVDDILALFSWIFMSNAAFILVGTTTFVSILLALANSLQFQEFIARKVGEYLTQETGIEFVFDSAIVPNWKDGKIRLRNVVLSKGPQRRVKTSNNNTAVNYEQVDGMIQNEAALGRDMGIDVTQLDSDEWDTNLTMFHLTIDQIEVTLNMMRWFDGKGLIENCSIKGVRGVIDRTHVYWDPQVPYIPSEHRHPHRPGDFEIKAFSVEDVLVTVLQPGGFRPYQVSILSAFAPRLRKRWLIYDILCVESMVGKFDNCLFSIHQAQHQGPPSSTLASGKKPGHKQPGTRVSELRIDGVNIDHLNAGVEGPFGWITSATVDISAYMTIPTEPEDTLQQLIDELVERVDAATSIQRSTGTFHDDLAASLARQNATSTAYDAATLPDTTPTTDTDVSSVMAQQRLVVDLNVRFNNVKASVPLNTDDLSYLNNALVRPVVAYMNWHRTCIPVQSTFSISLKEFDGSWTLYEANLIDTISENIGRAIVQLAADERERNRRLKRVGLWGLQSVTRNLIRVIDYGRGAKGFLEYTGLTQDVR